MRDSKVYRKFLKDVPEKIFKFSSINDNLKKSLKESYLWLSSPTSFNDPFECNLNLIDFKATKKELWKIKSETSTGNRKARRKGISKAYKKRLKTHDIYRSIYEQSIKKWGVCCFSREFEHILMWSHYAYKHQGVCLAFDPIASLNTLTIGDINYVVDHTPVNYFKEEEDSLIRMILMKSKVWEYEKEIRVFKDFNGSLPIPRQALKEVIFGCNTLEEDKNEVRDIVENNGYENVTFIQAKKATNSFSLSFDKL